MRRTTKTRPLAPTHALDHALEALAAGDPDQALRWAIPALADEGSGAAAADIVGRALAAAGRDDLAVDAYELAVALLTRQGLVGHAVAAAIALQSHTKDPAAARQVAHAFGAESPVGTDARPPALKSDEVTAHEGSINREQLIAHAAGALQAVPRPSGPAPSRPRQPLWGALPTKAFETLTRALEVHVVPAGHVLMREGEPGHGAFIVARGEVRVTRRDAGDGSSEPSEIELAVLGPGAIVGEMALVTDAPRFATVVATRGALVLEMPRDALNDAAREVPALGQQVIAFCHRRLVENVLRTSSILREVPLSEREGLAQQFQTRAFDPGQVLIAEGATGAGLHLIAAGTVEVRRGDGTSDVLRIATLGPGTCVGEISLVLRRPATASVVATQATVSLVLAASRFLDVVRDRPTLLARLYELAVRREDETLSVVAQEAEEIDDAVIV